MFDVTIKLRLNSTWLLSLETFYTSFYRFFPKKTNCKDICWDWLFISYSVDGRCWGQSKSAQERDHVV